MTIPANIKTERGSVIGYTSLYDATVGQIERSKLGSMPQHDEIVLKFVPVIENELSQEGFVYEHFGLNKVAIGVLAIFQFKTVRVRGGISGPPHWKPKDASPYLWFDGWADAEFGNKSQLSMTLLFHDKTTEEDVKNFIRAIRLEVRLNLIDLSRHFLEDVLRRMQ